MEASTYDLIVIGGGINGTGVARDAALRGMRVLLLEKNDFGAGTSAHSSRLIHGGIRYLAHLEFDLVAESLQERERLLHNAPHLVRPLAMAIPLYPGTKNPPFLVKLGMLLYDWFSWGKSMPAHHMLNRRKFLREYPCVQPERLLGGPVYYDAQADFPERICVENAMAAQETGHADMLNHAQVTAIGWNAGGLPQVAYQNILTGQTDIATGQALINAGGPWVDEILQHTKGTHNKKPLIGGTKGSHIVVRQFPDGPTTALYVEAKSDGRPFFIIPWRRHYYLIGTTDEHFEGKPDTVHATRGEVDYLLAETNAILPCAKLTLDDVLYTYSGIRPLPNSTETAGKVTRKHLIHASTDFPRVLSLIGGKLTTYRNLAEQAVDEAIRKYHLRQPNHQLWPVSPTGKLHLPGAKGMDDLNDYKRQNTSQLSQKYGVPTETVAHLIDFYGSRAEAVLMLCKENSNLNQSLWDHNPDIGAQVIYAIRAEMAKTLPDVLLRRLGFGLNSDAGFQTAPAVANLMAHELGWSGKRRQAEIEGYHQLIEQTALAFKKDRTEVPSQK